MLLMKMLLVEFSSTESSCLSAKFQTPLHSSTLCLGQMLGGPVLEQPRACTAIQTAGEDQMTL
jgi:hypothetical protein